MHQNVSHLTTVRANRCTVILCMLFMCNILQVLYKIVTCPMILYWKIIKV